MDHRLVGAIEKALSWSGPSELGVDVARGRLDDPGLRARLLTPHRLLDTAMRRALAPPQVRCFQNSVELHPDRYLARVVTRRGQALSMLDMDQLGALMADGCTLVLDALDMFDPTMEIACRALQWWSREIVQVNTYLTTNDGDGFSLHWDDHDVVVVQVAGEKSWQVRGRSRAAPMFRDAEHSFDPPEQIIWEGVLRAGEVLHVPRGYWHQASRAGLGAGYSLHATFGFVKRTGVDWVSWVADRSREDEQFRHDLHRHGPDPDAAKAAAEQERGLVAGMADLLHRYPVQAYLAAREHQQPPGRHVASRGVFGPSEAVVCVTAFPPDVRRDGQVVEVRAAGKKLTFAARAAEAVEMLLSGRPVSLAEARQATGIDADRIAEVLLQEGLCAELTDALSSGYTDMIPTQVSSPMP
jgi:hypothetical protein